MQKNNGTAKSAQRKTQNSTTLNRRYVKRPTQRVVTTTDIDRSERIQHFKTEPVGESIPIRINEQQGITNTVQRHPLQTTAINRMQALNSQQLAFEQQASKRLSAKEIKEQAIQKALQSAATANQDAQEKSSSKLHKMHFGFGRVALALASAAVVVFAIVYFVNLNMPDVSLRVAAMQTGINASYPGHVPRGYAVSSITSESKKIVLEFSNSSEGASFELTEEASSWDSNALLNNYVKTEFGDNYKTIKEQGLTIYISGSRATWVNGGVVYKITAENGTLSNKQICSIATSL